MNQLRVSSVVGVVFFAAVSARADVLVGEVRMWAGPVAEIPSGWLFCDGSEVSRTTYEDLFTAVGTIYGAGDGSTTFNLPDSRDRSPMGVTQDDGGVPKTNVSGSLTPSGGEAEHTLTVAEIPGHAHQPQCSTNGADQNNPDGNAMAFSFSNLIYRSNDIDHTMFPTTSTGGDQPHNNLHPYFAITYIIAAEPPAGAVPTVSEWGMAVMILLILAAGTLVLRRRQPATAWSSPSVPVTKACVPNTNQPPHCRQHPARRQSPRTGADHTLIEEER